ncbi:MAG: hypothetical protein RTU92_04945, partial [Candidatus Thorarchaeota archaeon]
IQQVNQEMLDIPLVEIEIHSGNATYTTLNRLVWMPDWIMSWKPLFIVLPIGNFTFLEDIEVNQAPPGGVTYLWTLNETVISWGGLIEMHGMGHETRIRESYSTIDGALLEYSFEFEDAFGVASNFTLVRTNIREIIASYIFQENMSTLTFLGGCMIIPIALLVQWTRINRAIKKIVTKRETNKSWN